MAREVNKKKKKTSSSKAASGTSNVKSGVNPDIVAIIIIALGIWVNTESFKRVSKSLDSTFNGGLDRTITLYDYNGNVIDSWSGTFDVQEDETRVFFDNSETGKRVIIYNGIVVNEEN